MGHSEREMNFPEIFHHSLLPVEEGRGPETFGGGKLGRGGTHIPRRIKKEGGMVFLSL